MKRFAALIICLILCCGLFTSCADTTTDTSDITSICFHSLREYEYYLPQISLPEDYIHVSRFHMLGTLRYGSITNHNYTVCRYNFSSGVDLNVYHSTEDLMHNSFFGSDCMTELPEGMENMLILPTPTGSYISYFRNGLYYIYDTRGKLQDIYWIADDTYFELVFSTTGNQLLSQYEDFPVLAQLLSASEDVADSALQTLCAEIGVTPERNHYRSRFEISDRIVQALFIGGFISIVVVSLRGGKKRRGISLKHRAKEQPSVSAFTIHESPFDTPNSH